ncbi:MAG: thiol reductase thioredoxin [Actinobacteria bacterium]|nr:thiol reductase thioredoxin [Actinomycetota bacterium]
MATIALDQDNFNKTIDENDLVLIDFWASWCGPCLRFAPIYEAASEKHPDAVFAKLDTESQPEVAGAFNIMSIPTLMIFRDQILLYAQPGAIPQEALEDLIAQAKALDMDDVRRKVAEHEHAEQHGEHETA